MRTREAAIAFVTTIHFMKSEQLIVRVSPAAKKRYRQVAKAAGLSLSAWVLRELDLAAGMCPACVAAASSMRPLDSPERRKAKQ